MSAEQFFGGDVHMLELDEEQIRNSAGEVFTFFNDLPLKPREPSTHTIPESSPSPGPELSLADIFDESLFEIEEPSASVPQELSQSAPLGPFPSVALEPSPVAMQEPSPSVPSSTPPGFSSSVPPAPPQSAPPIHPEPAPREWSPIAISESLPRWDPQKPPQPVPPGSSPSVPQEHLQSALRGLFPSVPQAFIQSAPQTLIQSALQALIQSAPQTLIQSAPQALIQSAPLVASPSIPIAFSPYWRQVVSPNVPPVASPYNFTPSLPRCVPDPIGLEKLTLQARGMPDHWVCEVCMDLHLATPNDTPSYGLAANISCPLQRAEWGRRAYASPTACRLDYRLPYQLDHRHIQLALKWTRLNDCARFPQLEALIRPTEPLFYQPTFDQEPNSPIATYQVQPKIININGGLIFMTKTIWKFTPVNERLNCDTVRDMAICPHLHRSGRGCHLVNRTPLNQIIGNVLYNNDGAGSYIGACQYCPTDYMIAINPGCLQVVAWQNFGSDTSPAANWWRSGCKWSLDSTIENQKEFEGILNPCGKGRLLNIYENSVEVQPGLYRFDH